jgi:exodeoxyribonuclease-1
MPLCIHPTNSNGIIVYDLRENPRDWIELSADEIRARVYTPADQLPEGIKRVALNIIYINKCPIVTSPAVLDPVRADLYEVDFEICRKHWDLIQNSPNIGNKIQTVFQEGKLERETDPDYMIYSEGFFSDNDRSLMQTVRATSPNDLARIDLPFRDKRLHEMLFRYRARNYRGSLNQSELERWNRFRLQRLTNEYARQRYESDMQLAMQREGENSSQVLSDLQNYVDSLTANI